MKVFSISRAGGEESRRLMLAYRLHDEPMAWECSLCGKFFSIPVEEAQQSAAQLAPPYIEREFRLHSCLHQLCGQFSDIEVYGVEGWPEERRYEVRTTAHGRSRR